MTKSTKCRALDGPENCHRDDCPENQAKIANAYAAYTTWRNGDMNDNDGRWARAVAYMEAEQDWACGTLVRVPSMSHDSGSETNPCRLRKHHLGDHDPRAKYPWQEPGYTPAAEVETEGSWAEGFEDATGSGEPRYADPATWSNAYQDGYTEGLEVEHV